MTGRVLTRAFSFETRQHSVLGWDLGEGVPRRPAVICAVIVIVWAGLLTLVVGPPSRRTFIFYVAVPGVIAWFGFSPSGLIPRRRRITMWVLRARYILIGHVGVINGGVTRRRHDLLHVRERITLTWWRRTFGSRARDWDPWTPQAAASRPVGPGPTVRIGQGVRVLGFDAMTPLRED
ncbi:hypothetical protein [Actinobaculum sp. 352]|uniref:hypothetical protein n=1 Tax=Actinobaculum sp. 352 TaxID=2490946 RepID=UPI000F7E7446|nr:hypothetical protein [Actinobaculum sp. 352]RTE49064.1 hypothetical protein EKN07_08025 [Actinobaculum sp. 352]